MSRLGHPRVHLRRTDSTNDRARELAIAGAPDGTLVTAGEQSAGRGRQGRRWSAPAASALLMSLLLRSPPPLLPLIAAVAVCDVVGEEAQIKWPNDVVLADATGALSKLAGILTEGRPQEGWVVLGIGLNVAVALEELPAELQLGRGPSRAGSLPAATLGLTRSEIEPTLARLLRALERRLEEPAEATLAAWRARDALCGREIAWGAYGAQGFSDRGRARGIDGLGRLLIDLAGGSQRSLAAGEVHLQEVGRRL